MKTGAFVLDGDHRAAVAVVRSLGKAGIPVTVGESHPGSISARSRYCRRESVYLSLTDHPDEAREGILRELAELPRGVLLPLTDIAISVLDPLRDRLPAGTVIAAPTLDVVKHTQDKAKVTSLAASCGLQVPATMLLETEQEEDVAPQLLYPMVIKPRFSRVQKNGHWISGTVRYARSPQEFLSIYRQVHSDIPFPLLQEKIKGEGRGVFLLVWRGELKAAFCHKRVRELPPSGGVSVCCESVPLDPMLVGRSYKLLQALSWEGPAMVEFKVDSRDGQPKLLEVNGRFWGSLQLAIDAGVDFPLIFYRLLQGESPAAVTQYRVGVRSRWLIGDLRRVWHCLHSRREDLPPDVSAGACLDYFRLTGAGTKFADLRIEDPKPFFAELGNLTRRLLA